MLAGLQRNNSKGTVCIVVCVSNRPPKQHLVQVQNTNSGWNRHLFAEFLLYLLFISSVFIPAWMAYVTLYDMDYRCSCSCPGLLWPGNWSHPPGPGGMHWDWSTTCRLHV